MTDEPKSLSMHAEMEQELARRKADREDPSEVAVEPTHDPAIAAADALVEKVGVEAEAFADKIEEEAEAVIDLDNTQEQRAAEINLTEVADIADTKPEVAAIPDDPKADLTNCGLPERLWEVKALVAYENLHSITGEMRDTIEYTGHERNMYDRYQKLARRSAAKEHFVTALRLFTHSFPEKRAEQLDLNKLKVS